MSKEINNREHRQKIIKELLSELHAGKSVEEVKHKFEQEFKGVSAAEISDAEQALITGGLPVSEVQRLCDVHAVVFKGSIEEIHKEASDPIKTPGHPANTIVRENAAIDSLIEQTITPNLSAFSENSQKIRIALSDAFKKLSHINVHYVKKENLLFPYLEKYGITAPPKVMWGVDDEIRGLIKESLALLQKPSSDPAAAKTKIEETVSKIREMIFKEENILLPMALDTLSRDEWMKIAAESNDLGFCMIDAPPEWEPDGEEAAATRERTGVSGAINLPTGVLSLKELTFLLNTLPADITFVDKDDIVKYFSEGAERIFPRTKAIIGRKVINCHPPASMHIVEKILEDFNSGKKSHEDFWINMKGKYIYIRYFAVRDESGKYLGTLEVTQDIAPIQIIDGEKRLVSDD